MGQFLSSGSTNLKSFINQNKSSTFNSFKSYSHRILNNGQSAHSTSSQSSHTLDQKPLSVAEYFKYSILFGIPIVGFILLIMFGFGNASNNINLRNFSRASFYSQLLLFIIYLLLVMTMKF